MSDKLSRGIDALERARKGRAPAINAAKGAPTTKNAVVALCTSTRMRRRRFIERAEALDKHMTTWRKGREANLASLPPKTRAELIAAEEPAERARAGTIYAEDFRKFHDDVTSAMRLASSTAGLFGDATAYLDTATLGNSKRSVYDAQLAGASYARIASAILKAAAEGDADLFASANAARGTLPKAAKEALAARIDVHATAELLAGDDLKAARGAISAISYFAGDLDFRNNNVIGVGNDADSKINLGLLQRDAAAMPEFLDETKDNNPQPTPSDDPAFAGAPRGTFSP